MSEPTMLQLRARITALEVFSSRFIIMQLHQLEAEFGREKVVDLIDQLDQQIAETVAQVAMRKPDEQEFSREVDAHLSWLMSLLRGQFKLESDEEE